MIKINAAQRAPNSAPGHLALEAAANSKSSAPVAHTCGFCGAASEKLFLCGKCKSVRYCDANHQRQHWFVIGSFLLFTINVC
jgi:hypothetical protein